MWTAESHFLVFIPNAAGHSLFNLKSYLCGKGASMFTQWAWSQLSVAYFSWSAPLLFSNLPYSKMSRYEKLPIGMPELQRDPSWVHTQKLLCSALGWGCQRPPGRQRIRGLSLLDFLLASSGRWRHLSAHPASLPKWEWLWIEVSFRPLFTSIFKGTNKVISASGIKWQNFSKNSYFSLITYILDNRF